MEELTISEVARRTGLRPSAIRYYESVQVLPAPRRVSGRRCYTPDIVQKLAGIQVAQQAGFTVAEMRLLFNQQEVGTPLSVRWQTLARQKMTEVEALISRAQGMKRLLEEGLNCSCLTLDDCIDCLVASGQGCTGCAGDE